MEQTTSPTKDEIKLLIDNALLQNNERMVDKFTKALDEKMNPTLNEVVNLAKEVGVMKSKVSNLWGKFIGIGAAISVVTALVTLLFTQGNS